MITLDQTIPCPTCNHKIPFDSHQLLAGMQFVCANCHSVIGLAAESKPMVQSVMQKLEAARSQPGAR